MLSIKSPLADAVCATVCCRWREGADLWLDVFREPRFKALSARCGLDAALNAGLYDLAQYFHVHLDEDPSLPDFLAEPWRQSLPIRRNRVRFYARWNCNDPVQASSPADVRATARYLVDLRLYREAIREIFRGRFYSSDPGAAVPLLALCYSALGEHEAFMALRVSRRWYFRGPTVRAMLQNAREGLARAERGAVENVLEFTRSHPAGPLLAPCLITPARVLSSNG